MFLRLLSSVLPPKAYLWVRYRLDKYFGAKGMDSKNILHYYWRKPPAENAPSHYLPNAKNVERSRRIVEKMRRHLEAGDTLLELGCNVGRNLSFLQEAGFKNVSGVEINSDALELLRRSYPKLAESASLHNSSIENFFSSEPRSYDAIFTCEVMEHIPRESQWVFEKIAAACRKILVTYEIEDANVDFHRIVGRPYKDIFTKLGMNCVSEDVHGNYVLRVFEKNKILSKI